MSATLDPESFVAHAIETVLERRSEDGELVSPRLVSDKKMLLGVFPDKRIFGWTNDAMITQSSCYIFLSDIFCEVNKGGQLK